MSVLTEDMKRLVREQRLGYVATVSPDGSPNVSPKGSMTVLDEDTLVFADIESPHTIRNLASEPRTEINVVDPLTRKGYRFRAGARSSMRESRPGTPSRCTGRKAPTFGGSGRW